MKFIDTSNEPDIEIKSDIDIRDGMATYTWEGLPEGTYQVKAVYSGDANYNTATSNSLSLDMRKENQLDLEITDIGRKTYGDSSFQLLTLGGNGVGDVNFKSSDSSILSIEDNIGTIHKAGNVNITVTKAEDSDYNQATVLVPLTIGRKSLSIKADDWNIIKGELMPKLTYTTTGLVADDRFITEPTITAINLDRNKAGEYDINISDGTLENTDSYEISYIKGKITVADVFYSVTVKDGTGEGRLADTNSNKDKSDEELKTDAYYRLYTEWASDKGILKTIGENNFAPEMPISREQMAWIMANYARLIGVDLPKV